MTFSGNIKGVLVGEVACSDARFLGTVTHTKLAIMSEELWSVQAFAIFTDKRLPSPIICRATSTVALDHVVRTALQ